MIDTRKQILDTLDRILENEIESHKLVSSVEYLSFMISDDLRSPRSHDKMITQILIGTLPTKSVQLKQLGNTLVIFTPKINLQVGLIPLRYLSLLFMIL